MEKNEQESLNQILNAIHDYIVSIYVRRLARSILVSTLIIVTVRYFNKQTSLEFS